MKKRGIITIITIILLSFGFSGCLNKSEKNSKNYKIVNNTNSNLIVATKKQEGIEFILKGTINENDITVSDKLLKIIKYKDENTILSIAGDIKANNALFEIVGEFDILETNTAKGTETNEFSKRSGEKLLGDFDNSGTVDLADFTAFAKSYGIYTAAHDIAPALKGNGDWSDIYCIATPDNLVNLNDFVIFAQNYGRKTVVPVLNWPNSTNTGIPVGTPELTVYTANMHTKYAGQIFDAVELQGRLYVDHPNVIIRRSRLIGDIYDAVYCTALGTGLTIEDCDIVGGVKITDGFTGRRNHMHARSGGTRNDGLAFYASHVLLEDNLIDGLVGSPGAHMDGIQVMGGDDIVIRHNWIELKPPSLVNVGVNAAIFLAPDLGEITNVVIDGNMLIEESGYYPIRISARGKVDVTHNRVRPGYLGRTPYNIINTVITNWEDNTLEDGTVISAPPPVKLVKSITITTNKTDNSITVGGILTASAIVLYNDNSTSTVVGWASSDTWIPHVNFVFFKYQ